MEEIHYLLGNSCKLNCDFCFWDIRMPDTTLEFKKKIVDKIIQANIKKVTISGGEPSENPNFLEILEHMHKNNLETIVHTNGLSITDKIAEKMANYTSRVSLTLDGFDKEVLSLMRKDYNITNHTLHLIKLFQNLNTPTNIKTLVTKINKNEIPKIGDTLKSFPIQYWSLLEFIPINRGNANKDKFYISPLEFDTIYEETKNKFPGLEIRKRRFTDKEKDYCFIAPDGGLYTYLKDKGDILIGNIQTTNLNSL
ncbi:MAG: radical SAM protein [Candidatus Nanoarchaeia archaeon]|nr:radical SAM protein [Candidatus Nanoarchaeia archaeon]